MLLITTMDHGVTECSALSSLGNISQIQKATLQRWSYGKKFFSQKCVILIFCTYEL